LAALLAPIATIIVVLALVWLQSEVQKRRFVECRLLFANGSAAGAGFVVAAALVGPLGFVVSTIPLRPVVEDAVALGLAAIATIIFGLIVYLVIRHLQGLRFMSVLGAASILSIAPFIGLQFAVIQYLENTEESRRFGYLEVDLSRDIPITTRAQITQVASDLEFISSLASDSAGRIIYTEYRSEGIGVLDPRPDGTFQNKIVGRVPIPEHLGGLQGLWHVVLNPSESYLYAWAIESVDPDRAPLTEFGAGDTSRVVRFSYKDGDLGPMEVLMSGIPAGVSQSGGSMTFGPDGNLYLAVGDGDAPLMAQLPSSIIGSILRLTPEGEIPDDNPFSWSPVYAYGFRNPYGIAHDLESEALYITDNGPMCCDRLVQVERGRFHGWPDYGAQPSDIFEQRYDDRVVTPLIETGDPTVSPTQLISYRGRRYGSEFVGNLFFPTFKEGAIHRIALSPDGSRVETDEIVFRFDPHRPVIGITATPDGHIYFSSHDSIYRIDSFVTEN